MIKYLKANCNLLTFEVVKGLVSKQSVKGEYLFNKYVKTLFAEKAQQDILKITNEHNPAYRETIKLFLNAVTGKFVENVDLYEDNVFTINKTKFVKDLPVKEIKTFKQQQIEKNTRNYVQHIGKEMDESINRELYDYLLWNYKFEVAQDQYRLKPETEERELKLTYIKKCLSQCFMNNIQFESINVQESHNVYIRNHKTIAELYQEREMLVREWIETNETLDIELPTEPIKEKKALKPVDTFTDTGIKNNQINDNFTQTETRGKKQLNQYMGCGVMIYSYSKRLLFEYINLLPNKSEDVIHIETDSVYFNRNNGDEFKNNVENYAGDYPVKIGDELGNVKQEKDEEGICHFLGKKFYQIGDIFKIKGIPMKTITEDGTLINIVNQSIFERVFAGENVRVEYTTLKKNLYGKTYISQHKCHRTINSHPKLYTNF